MTKKCLICQKDFETKKYGESRLYCYDCSVPDDGSEKLYKKQKEKARNLLGGRCVVCGYSRNGEVLDFHHLDPEEKGFIVAQNGKSFENLLLEARKCTILCANCHREYHLGYINDLPRQDYKKIDLHLDFIKKEKEKIEKVFCKKCGIEIYKYNKTGLCNHCSRKERRVVDRPAPRVVAKEVLETSFVAVGRKYEVSDNAIRKWLRYYGLPTKKKELKKWLDKNV